MDSVPTLPPGSCTYWARALARELGDMSPTDPPVSARSFMCPAALEALMALEDREDADDPPCGTCEACRANAEADPGGPCDRIDDSSC